MRSTIIVFVAILLVIACPFIWDFIDSSLSDEYDQNFAGVSTVAGVFSANVTLARDIFEDDEVFVTDISSNITSDTPSTSAYNSVSRVLTISGLEENTDRTLAMTFLVDSGSLDAGMIRFLTLLRWFYVFIVIGFFGGAVYAFFQS